MKTLAERLNDVELMRYDSMTREELESMISKEIEAITRSIDGVRKYAASVAVSIEVNKNDTIEKQLRLLHPAASVLLRIYNALGNFNNMLDWQRSTADGMSSMLKNQSFTFKSINDYLVFINRGWNISLMKKI